MTVYLCVCQQDCTNTMSWNFMKKNERIRLGPTQIRLHFDTIWITVWIPTKKSGFSHVLIIACIGGGLRSPSAILLKNTSCS